MSPAHRILIAEDHASCGKDSLPSSKTGSPDMQVVAPGKDGQQAVELYWQLSSWMS